FLLGGVFDHLRQELAGAADERNALRVFIATRPFADEDERRFFVAYSKHELGAAFVQPAAAAVAHIGEDLQKRIIRGRHGGQRLGDRGHFGSDHALRGCSGGLRRGLFVEGLDSQVLVELQVVAQELGGHCAACSASRSFRSSSKMRSAISRLDARATGITSPVRSTSTTSFSSDSKSVSLPPTRLPTTISQFFDSILRRDSCCKFCVSAAKPTNRRSPFLRPNSARISGVGSSSTEMRA